MSLSPAWVTTLVVDEVRTERYNQDQKWGEQNHPDVDRPHGRHTFAVLAQNYKASNDRAVGTDRFDWTGVLLEEIYEALAESDPALLRAELIQSAAVIVAWVECIDRRASVAKGEGHSDSEQGSSAQPSGRTSTS